MARGIFLVVTLMLMFAADGRAANGQGAAAAGCRMAVCSLLPKAEVRKHLPWNDVLDRMPPEEEAGEAALIRGLLVRRA